MLKMKTIENLIKKYNEENGVEIKLTTMDFFLIDNVLAVELDGVKNPLGRVHIASNLFTSFRVAENKKEVLRQLNNLKEEVGKSF